MADWLQIKKERGKKKQGWLLAIDCLINQSQNEKGRGKDAVEWQTELHNKKETRRSNPSSIGRKMKRTGAVDEQYKQYKQYEQYCLY